MGTCDLPDMYALSPRASGIHIRQSTLAHVITMPKALLPTYIYMLNKNTYIYKVRTYNYENSAEIIKYLRTSILKELFVPA